MWDFEKVLAGNLISDLTHCKKNLSVTSAESVILSEQVVKELSLEKTSLVKLSIANKQTILASDSYENINMKCQKTPYNQKVEQGLKQKISFYTKVNDEMFDIQMPKLSLEAILMKSGKTIVQNIVDLFRVAIKLRYISKDIGI